MIEHFVKWNYTVYNVKQTNQKFVEENTMFLVLHLNSRLQPMHRFEIEDALTEIFESNNNVGKITGGGTAMFPSGEIESCDIEIEFSNMSEDFEWLLNLLDNI